MLNLTKLRKRHMNLNDVWSALSTTEILRVIEIAIAAVKYRDSMMSGNSDDEGDNLLELLEDVEVGDA